MPTRKEKEQVRQQRLAAERAAAKRAERRRDLIWFGGSAVALLVAVVVVLLALSGGKRDQSRAAQPVPAVAAGNHLPHQIAVNLRDGNKVVVGDLQNRLGALRGVPVVVNQWASWCPNCQAEFGFFAQLADKYVKRVAFLGLDAQDREADAESFLKSHPVNYPSVFDQDARQASGIGAGVSWPTTVFIDRTGEITFVRQGGYTTAASLEADIRRYALGV